MRVLKLVSEKVGFATNSSSYHQVVYQPNGNKEFKINLRGVSKANPVHIASDEYGRNGYGAACKTWQEKASYVMTWYCNRIDYDVPVGLKCNDMEELQGFKKMLEKHVGKGCIVLDGEQTKPNRENWEYGDEWKGNIDHQSADLLDGCSPTLLEEIIFSDSIIWVESDEDRTHNDSQWVFKKVKKK